MNRYTLAEIILIKIILCIALSAVVFFTTAAMQWSLHPGSWEPLYRKIAFGIIGLGILVISTNNHQEKWN